MKKVEATIQRHRLDVVMEALLDIGVQGMTVIEVRERGGECRPTLTYRGVTSEQKFGLRSKIEVVVADDDADAVIDAIFQTAHTGEQGDGSILVTPLESVVRIRTGEEQAEGAMLVNESSHARKTYGPNPAAAGRSSENWFGARTFQGSDAAAMNYWANRAET